MMPLGFSECVDYDITISMGSWGTGGLDSERPRGVRVFLF